MPNLRIGILAPTPVGPGGTTSGRVLPMARALAASGHQVDVFLPGPADPLTNDRLTGSAANQTLNFVALPGTGRGPTAPFRRPLYQVGLALGGFWRLATGDYDAIHIFKPTGATGLALALLWAIRAAPAVILDTDAWEGPEAWSPLKFPSSLRRAWGRLQEQVYLRTNDAVTAASNRLLERLGRTQLQTKVANFYDQERYHDWAREDLRTSGRKALGLDLDQKVVLFYTRFAEYPVDSYAALIEAIRTTLPGTRIVVLGDGGQSESDRLRGVLNRSGVTDDVLHLGWVERDLLPAILASCDVACLPALDTPVNAAACPIRFVDLLVVGLPVVAHNVGEAPTYVMPGRNGRLLPPSAGPRQLAGAIGELIEQPRRRDVDHYSRMRISGDLSPDSAARSLERVYQRVIAS